MSRVAARARPRRRPLQPHRAIRLELGYLALPEGAAELVFQVISERIKRASLIVTSNLPFGEWTKVFAELRPTKAVVHRLATKRTSPRPAASPWRFKHGLARINCRRGALA